METGMGCYNMTQLKELNRDITSSLPFRSGILSDYPPFWYFRPGIYVDYKKVSVGISLTFASTGSRISTKDYSGEYLFHTELEARSPEVTMAYNIMPGKKLQFLASATLGRTLTKMYLGEFFQMYDSVIFDNNVILKARHFYVEPGAIIRYTYRFISFDLHVGYGFQLGKQSLSLSGDSGVSLLFPNSMDEVKPDWGGLRAGLGLSFCLK